MTIIHPAHSKSCSGMCGQKLVQGIFSGIVRWEKGHSASIKDWNLHKTPPASLVLALFYPSVARQCKSLGCHCSPVAWPHKPDGFLAQTCWQRYAENGSWKPGPVASSAEALRMGCRLADFPSFPHWWYFCVVQPCKFNFIRQLMFCIHSHFTIVLLHAAQTESKNFI